MSNPADRIAVLGAGQMGNGIAHVFAQAGFGVTMIDISRDALARGRDTIAKNLDRQVKKGTVTADDKSFDSGNVTKGHTFSKKFTAIGSYSYYCKIHSFMKATITVVQPYGSG